MPLMIRRCSIFLLVLAALMAVEPLLHSHPLQPNSIPETCAVCASGVAPLPMVVPAISAPQNVVYTLVATTTAIRTVTVAITLPSRAPPAA